MNSTDPLEQAVADLSGNGSAARIPPPPDSSGPAEPIPCVREGTPEEAKVARQKAEFVLAVWDLAAREKRRTEDAVHFIAASTNRWDALVTKGKKGGSLLGEKSAYANYRGWSKRLGTEAGSNRPDVANWRALLPAYRGSRQYERPGHSDFWLVLAQLYENRNQLSLKHAYRMACLTARQAQPPIEIPTLNAVQHFYQFHADKKAVLIAREGVEAFRNQVAGYITRQAPPPDEAWVGDHHLFDAAVKVWDCATRSWRAVRPWLTAWIDWGSLSFVGWKIRVEKPNRDVIERALRHGVACNENHPPVRLYMDNGKDYKATGFSPRFMSDKDAARLQTVCEGLGSIAHYAIPFNARAKVPERCFRVVAEQFSKRWLSYRGSKPENRPEQADVEWKNPAGLPSLEDFTAEFATWVENSYHKEPSDGDILNGRSPVQAREGMAHPRPPLSPEQIHRAFLRELPGLRSIGRGGTVWANGREYRSEALWQLLGRVEKVRVKVDPDNLDFAWIFDVDGREIGPAEVKPILPAFVDPAKPHTIEQLRAEQHRHAKQIKDAKAASAAVRGMSRFSQKAPALLGSLSGFQPPVSSAPSVKSVVPSSPSIPASAADIEALDGIISSRSRERLDSIDGPVDEADLSALEALEHQQRRDDHGRHEADGDREG